MIAPRKKKFIKLILMAWSVVLVITGSALPVFATVVTDDQGNASPRSYRISWYIYSTETETYQEVNVTSQVTIDGLKFTFPTNLYGVNRLSCRLDFLGSGYSTYIQSISVSYFINYSSSSFEGLCTLVDDSTFNWYYFLNGSSTSVRLEKYLTGSSNPNSYDIVRDSPSPFSFCMMSFFPNAVYLGGNFSITFSSFVFDGVDIKDQIYISQLEDSTEDLDDSVEALETALPLPTFDASAFASAEAIADDYTFFNDGLRFSFMESDLVTHIFILVVYFTCLSIAIFGHAGG